MITQKFFMGGGGKAGPITAGTTQSRGCTLTRYIGGVGTFIEYKAPDGSDAVMEVIDAQYRPTGLYKWAASTTNLGIPNITTASYFIYNNKAYDSATAMPPEVTMSYLLSNHGSKWASDGTATSNNQYFNSGSYSAGYYCYNLSIDSSNGKWLLPTCWQLHVIWMLSDDIDAIEEPASSYSTLRLGCIASSGRFRGRWFLSCSEQSASYMWVIHNNGRANRDGTKTDATHYVLPIREH